MEVSGKRQQGDGTDQRKGILCDLCNEENEEEAAVSFCTVCNEYLCEADTKAHRKAKVLKDHVLLDGDEMPHQKLKALEDNTCSTHNGKQIEYYCVDHSKWCCTLCATVEHRECDIAYIDDIAEDYELGEEYTSLVEAIDNQNTCLKNTKKDAAKKQAYVQLNLEKLISEVKKFRVELNAALDFLESATLKEIQLLLDTNNQHADSVSTQCDIILSEIQDISSIVENLKKYKKGRQLVFQSKKALAQIPGCERKIAELSHQNTIQEYMFSPNDEILQSLKKLNTLGQFPGMNDRYPPKVIDQEANGELSASCGQSAKGLTRAGQNKENKGTVNMGKSIETNKTIVADLVVETKASLDAGRTVETRCAVDHVRDLDANEQISTDTSLEAKDQINAEKCPNATDGDNDIASAKKKNISDRSAPCHKRTPKTSGKSRRQVPLHMEQLNKTRKKIKKGHRGQINNLADFRVQPERKSRDNSPKSIPSSDDLVKEYITGMDLARERKGRDNSPKSIDSNPSSDEEYRCGSSYSKRRLDSFTRSKYDVDCHYGTILYDEKYERRCSRPRLDSSTRSSDGDDFTKDECHPSKWWRERIEVLESIGYSKEKELRRSRRRLRLQKLQINGGT